MKSKKRNIGQEILESIESIKSGKGKRYKVYTSDDIKKVRNKLELSQSGFASILHVSTRTLQAWEQGRRNPSGAALALLTIAAARPDVIQQVLKPSSYN
ncbi:MAG: helix-turn-helix domain-containing protein [Rickettsiales bacterium]